ncbi:hypothetical protein halTADL_0867 [Halohasta litchfieldiae]|jgi:hypothetical protein|uniref:Uncharacterized protein n=1 Tax=Halohasta litchfieldiae TaxID=1073996 RepID=A0A1H6TKS7_9EURY|nr:DUF5788 family protein [Halohasta litchfieldiae]ATW87663.1 hypothetical protein halTADL_0867 [Halohasta litchfieldiae]SEI76372.1 hypothetical protein SAMN05444271_107115 [Halohasta litchfieldiae]
MDDSERTELLQQVNRQSATVGATIPETVTIHGEELQLREFLIETRKVDRISAETSEIVSTAKRVFREERAKRVDRLKSDPLDREEAEQLADEIVGIDRALNALETIRHPDFGDESHSSTIEDHKRWLGFLEAVQ